MLISIITPTYNRELLVQQTIHSILNQSMQEWELIVVDDGSTDNTKAIMQQFTKDPRIRYFLKEHSGQPDSLNFGVRHANGDFITFLDSDDEAYPNWLERTVSEINRETGIICCAAKRKLIDGTLVEENLKECRMLNKMWKVKFTCGSFFVRKNLFLQVGGYDAELKCNIQTDLGYRIIKVLNDSHMQALAIDDYLVQINVHNGERIRTNWQKRVDGGIQFINKHYSFIYQNDPGEVSNIYSSIAYASYKVKKRMQSVNFLLKAIRHNPSRLINYLRFFRYTLWQYIFFLI